MLSNTCMSTTKLKGQIAESKAAKYFQQNGFKLLEKNYRYRRAEIDLVVGKADLLVFVEVKYRKSNDYGEPEQFVTTNQQTKILEAADEYIHQNNWNGNIRFDIVAINAQGDLEHFEDAFY